MPLEGAKSTWPFASCSMDLITDLPLVDGCDSILVVVDRANTKGAILIPTTKTLTQEGAGQLLLYNLYKQFGLPDKMLSDRGPQFAAMAFSELLKLLGVKSNLTTAYHPQTDRATEWVNQEIKAYLSIYCSAHPMEWKNSLSTLEFTHNDQRHADQTHTSFELMHGEAPLAIPTSFENTKFPSVAEKIKNLVTSRVEALAGHELARSQWLSESSQTSPHSRKDKWYGWTLDIWRQITTRKWHLNEKDLLVTYQLKLPESQKIYKVFHATLLCPYKENKIYGENYPQPLPDVKNGEEVYKVEQVLKHRRRGQGYEYLVRWAGYPITKTSWEPKSSFTGAAEILQEYQEHHQL